MSAVSLNPVSYIRYYLYSRMAAFLNFVTAAQNTKAATDKSLTVPEGGNEVAVLDMQVIGD